MKPFCIGMANEATSCYYTALLQLLLVIVYIWVDVCTSDTNDDGSDQNIGSSFWPSILS